MTDDNDTPIKVIEVNGVLLFEIKPNTQKFIFSEYCLTEEGMKWPDFLKKHYYTKANDE